MNHKNEITEWVRICPKCGGQVYHKSKKDRNRREKEGRTCGGKANLNCKIISKEQRKLQRCSLKGKSPNHDQTKRRRKNTPTQFSRNCPKCNNIIYYSNQRQLKYSDRDDRLCNRCTKYEYKLTWKDVITENSIKQMRATKAGFKNWSEYKLKFPKWKRYKAEVWKHTRKSLKHNPILKNFNKRGRCGVKGSYQVDHIISVRDGFNKHISPKKIGAYGNLRMLPWKENLLKG